MKIKPKNPAHGPSLVTLLSRCLRDLWRSEDAVLIKWVQMMDSVQDSLVFFSSQLSCFHNTNLGFSVCCQQSLKNHLLFLSSTQTFGEPLMVSYLCAHHLWKQVPVVAVNLWREVVHTKYIVCTVGQDTGTIRGPSLEKEGGWEKDDGVLTAVNREQRVHRSVL